ncbi:MAG: hypothetical protein HFG90_03125 [Acholeplasmatales bacterium]|jgi:hypothetical protein|uniref:hypothetical protein n=1 Tax=Thomasclavelia cocleata TaxID=69824 RepID=UPI002590617A|nr:hypothetical protein [Thomasclavelia cocleata]MCI9182227.1 hypothetical protein [Acholeplasmatales bacterium]
MSEKLRIIDNIKIIEEHSDASFSGHLICDCGYKSFSIFHTGKRTKGILAPYLIKKKKQIVIKAVCKNCGKKIVIYDSNVDGRKPLLTKKYPEEKFFLKNFNDEFEIIMKYNYFSNDYKTNQFLDCFIEIKNKDMKKIKQLY